MSGDVWHLFRLSLTRSQVDDVPFLTFDSTYSPVAARELTMSHFLANTTMREAALEIAYMSLLLGSLMMAYSKAEIRTPIEQKWRHPRVMTGNALL
jgi:hypothetical protein